MRVGALVVDPGARTADLDGEPLDLTAREFDLLALLAANAPNVVSRPTMLDRIWRETTDVHPNIVDVYIGHLRRKIDEGQDTKLIRTVRGLGYMLDGDHAQ